MLRSVLTRRGPPCAQKCAPYREAGEIRDRTTEGQHYRIAGLNLLTAVIIYWNTVHLGHAVTERRNEGLDVPLNFFPTYPHWAGRTFY
ncbi:Tn3 family transposase [Klebsiella pneumoniae]|uniref:Tn3 family transposase n=1 Tax=Klebsiella pneumoniae TaxID=573 RepID=UPI0021F79DAB|nr:Tn3 family transposase [Klebsiella pneumoniae]UYS06572.1 Tn3 family transposase [Klebsiella pneumoniae]